MPLPSAGLPVRFGERRNHPQVLDGLCTNRVVTPFHHLSLELQVLIEGYIHNDPAKTGAVLLMKALCVLVALACIVSVLKSGSEP
jgi:succinate dehydrogenase / fumarate reductase membrane anchor subunit